MYYPLSWRVGDCSDCLDLCDGEIHYCSIHNTNSPPVPKTGGEEHRKT